MSGHTPGPWKVVGPVGHVYATNPYGRGDMHVGQVRGWGHLTGTGGGCAMDEEKAIAIQDANARLIAAAPELLAALKVAIETIHLWHGPDEPDAEAWALYQQSPEMRQIVAAIAKAEDTV